MKTLKIVILGAGFCGIAAAYYFTQYKTKGVDLEISLVDRNPLADNASGISAGLLHAFTGPYAKLARRGREGQAAAMELLHAAANALGQPIALKTGLLRIAFSKEQKQDFYKTAEAHQDVSWLTPEECQHLAPGIAFEPGIFIESAYAVKTALYLKGLWAACESAGARWISQEIISLRECSDYDILIVATGAYTKQLPELAHLPMNILKGQILKIQKPPFILLKTPISSTAYVLEASNPNHLIVGATFERTFMNEKADPKTAIADLLPKAALLFPSIKNSDVINCQAGLRASTPNHLPLVKREGENIWVITGMGSKGLLYHALYTKELIDAIMTSKNILGE